MHYEQERRKKREIEFGCKFGQAALQEGKGEEREKGVASDIASKESGNKIQILFIWV